MRPGSMIIVSILDWYLWDEWDLWDEERKIAGFAFFIFIKLSHHSINLI